LRFNFYIQYNYSHNKRIEEWSKELAALAMVLNTSCLLHERDLRLQVITQARLEGDARLPNSKITQQQRLCILNRMKRNLLIHRRAVTNSRVVVRRLQTHLISIYPVAGRMKRSFVITIETHRNSIFVACWQVTVPGKSQKLHYYPAVTRLSASVMRADILSCGDRVVTAKFRGMKTGRCITLGETPRRRRHTSHPSNNRHCNVHS